jgi:hypothetical protein
MSAKTKLFRLKVMQLFLSDKAALKFVLGYIAIFCSIGCFVGTPSPSNYAVIKDFSPMWVWGCLFGLLGVLRIATGVRFFSDGVEVFIAALGIWLWSHLVISFIIKNPTPLTPFKLIFLGILAGEIWLLTHSLFFHESNWRKTWLRQ